MNSCNKNQRAYATDWRTPRPDDDRAPTDEEMEQGGQKGDRTDEKDECSEKIYLPQTQANCWYVAVLTLCVRVPDLFKRLPPGLQSAVRVARKSGDCPRLPPELRAIMWHAGLRGSLTEGGDKPITFLGTILQYAELERLFHILAFEAENDPDPWNIDELVERTSNICKKVVGAIGGMLLVHPEDTPRNRFPLLHAHTFPFTVCGNDVVFCSWGGCHRLPGTDHKTFGSSFGLEGTLNKNNVVWILLTYLPHPDTTKILLPVRSKMLQKRRRPTKFHHWHTQKTSPSLDWSAL